MAPWLYAIVCVLVPAAWGLVMYHAFSFMDRRRMEAKPDDPPPIDYSI
jgi:hypothetical protein